MNNYLVIIDTAYGWMPVLVYADSPNEVRQFLEKEKMIGSGSYFEIIEIKKSDRKGIIKFWSPTGG